MRGPGAVAVLIGILSCGGALANTPEPGDHSRKLQVDSIPRSYTFHIPKGFDPAKPAPVVLVLHGAATNAAITIGWTGMNEKSDQAGFVAVYPNGTGSGPFLTWNSGGRSGRMAEGAADDVRFIDHVLDDLAKVVRIDPKRVYATGLSNGGMMCYRLAAELSHRIAAIAPVAGTMAIADAMPPRPVPVIHFHGTDDKIVPFEGPGSGVPRGLTFKSVDDSIAAWCKVNGCAGDPMSLDYPDSHDDGTTVHRKNYGPGKDGAEVVLIEVRGGGHTWPGQPTPLSLIGKSTMDVSANDLMWDFFAKHPMP